MKIQKMIQERVNKKVLEECLYFRNKLTKGALKKRLIKTATMKVRKRTNIKKKTTNKINQSLIFKMILKKKEILYKYFKIRKNLKT